MKSARKELCREHKVLFMDNNGAPLLAKKYPRNLECWCGSGKKCKVCCGNETKYFHPKPFLKQETESI
jgi:uncharacterized protein YchJ